MPKKLAAKASEEEMKKLEDESKDEDLDETELADDEAADDESKAELADDEDSDEAEMADDDSAEMADGDADSESDEDDEEEEAPKPAETKKAKKLSQRAELSQALAVLSALKEVTGKSDLSEAVGALRAMKISHDSTAKLSKRVAEMEKDSVRTQVRGMVEKAIKLGKLTPAQRDQFVKIGVRDRKELKGLLDTMPARVAMEGAAHKPAESKVGTAALSREEVKLARQLGTLDAYTDAKTNNKLISFDYEPEDN